MPIPAKMDSMIVLNPRRLVSGEASATWTGIGHLGNQQRSGIANAAYFSRVQADRLTARCWRRWPHGEIRFPDLEW